MKKLLVVFLLSCMPVMASNWVISPNGKSVYDTESMQFVKSKDRVKLVYYWQKMKLADGSYIQSEMAINCRNRDLYQGMQYVYNSSGLCINVISADPKLPEYAIAPDTTAMHIYNTYCK